MGRIIEVQDTSVMVESLMTNEEKEKGYKCRVYITSSIRNGEKSLYKKYEGIEVDYGQGTSEIKKPELNSLVYYGTDKVNVKVIKPMRKWSIVEMENGNKRYVINNNLYPISSSEIEPTI